MKHEQRILEARRFISNELERDHPPQFSNAYKQSIYADLKSRRGAAGTLFYSRWDRCPLPENVPSKTPRLAAEPTLFHYRDSGDGVWYLNFADPELFCAYGSALLAQDELQVLEHPLLASLREALIAEKWPTRTEEHDGTPTPVLVRGVERRLELDTAPSLEKGRERGLYGNLFARATPETITNALTVFETPRASNILAIAALVGGGPYTLAQIERTLEVAYSGFSAVVSESKKAWPTATVVVHTGFWGCGAFGGNRTLMVLLQILAAQLAGIDTLQFHCVTAAGMLDYESGREAYDSLMKTPAQPLSSLLQRILDRGYVWGQSDGN